MKFYVVDPKGSPPVDRVYPSCTLTRDNWDDYSHKTLFQLSYYPAPNKRMSVGAVKIMSLVEPKGYDQNGYVKLPSDFTNLEAEFCSLGQDKSYYTELKNEHGEIYQAVLDALNDVVLNRGILEEFENTSIFRSSLTRFSEAEKALREGRRILEGTPISDSYEFSFSCKIGSATKRHKASFTFSEDSVLPERIVAIVGNNGTGKTQFLSKMALTLSGESNESSTGGKFFPNRPSFSKVIAVSYSAFDKFERPSKKRTFSYIYCGLKDKEGFLTAKKLESRYEASIGKIISANREPIWNSVLKNVIDKERLETIYDELFCDKIFSNVAHNSQGYLSSGQSILMYVVTEILANIREESLILFDEPEMHLHPNAIAKLIKMINAILDRFNSFAILATHSPIILQEIPSKCVRVFEREGSVPSVRNLSLESFGENLTTITKNVFETVNTTPNYKEIFDKLSRNYSFEEINELFDSRLSLNATIYLQGLYEGKQ